MTILKGNEGYNFGWGPSRLGKAEISNFSVSTPHHLPPRESLFPTFARGQRVAVIPLFVAFLSFACGRLFRSGE